MPAHRGAGSKWGPAMVAVAALAGVTVAVLVFQRLPQGPVEITWDKEACANCHMHIGDPRFAAQVQLNDGQVLNFDDPGCALRALADIPGAELHAVWFHDLSADRWLARDEVGFVEAQHTPMGWGLGAVPKQTPGAVSLEQTMQHVKQLNAPAERTSWR